MRAAAGRAVECVTGEEGRREVRLGGWHSAHGANGAHHAMPYVPHNNKQQAGAARVGLGWLQHHPAHRPLPSHPMNKLAAPSRRASRSVAPSPTMTTLEYPYVACRAGV